MTKEIFTRELLEHFKGMGLTTTEISKMIYGHPENYRNIRRAYRRHSIEPCKTQPLKPSREELEQMINSGKTPYEIANELGYGNGGWSNIYKYCRDYGITDFDFSTNAEAKSREVKGDIASVVFGTLLGDATVNSYGALVVCHGEKQLSYLKWIKEKLGWLAMPKLYKSDRPHKPPFSKLPTYSVRSHHHPFLKELREKLWINGEKRISSLLDRCYFDELSLAVWYFDDGSLNKNSGVVTFATNGFPVVDVELIREFMRERFDIQTVLEPRRNNTYSIRINKSKTPRFFDLIKSRIEKTPPSMEYKIPSQ
jgi:hypothetical protein